MKKLFAIILVGLFMPIFCFGTITPNGIAVNYERSPSGYSILSPVSISISANTIDDLCRSDCNDYWGLKYACLPSDYITEKFSSSTLSHIFVEDLPVGAVCWDIETECFNEAQTCVDHIYLEFDDPNWDPIFEIIEYEIIFEMPETSVGSTTGIITDLVDAIGPFIWAFIGIPLGFVVVRRIIKILPR